MVIDYIYSNYFQKSKVFLYPLLGIPFQSNPVMFETFMIVDDPAGKDRKLFVVDLLTDQPNVYTTKANISFEQFFKNNVMKNQRFVSSELIGKSRVRCYFDLSDLRDDVEAVKLGRYSKISDTSKKKLMNYFPVGHGNRNYLKSYLYPDLFIRIYAQILDVEEDLLREVGELCDKPNFEKEHVVLSENISLTHVFEKRG